VSQAHAQTSTGIESVVVTARLRAEDAQTVPVSLSVVDGNTLTNTFTNNVSQLSLLAPSLNYTSPNPRNTAFTIRIGQQCCRHRTVQ
jgi:iron complex outermembrane receptor protein